MCSIILGAIGPLFGARHLQSLLLFFGITINYALRLNTSVSVVAMTDAKTTNPNFHEFNWDEKNKSYILSSFYWGYALFQLPGSYVVRKIGVKRTILIGTLTCSILNLFVPYCVFWGGWQVFSVIRVLQGMCQGLLFPSVYQHLANWSPLEERNRLGAFSHTGLECGTIIGMYVTGMIAASNFGWPGIFYVFSGIGIVFSLIWLIFAENNPANAKLITESERSYIIFSQETSQRRKNIPVPWKALLTSTPLISLAIVRSCDSWGYTTMQTEIPAYLHGALKMDISSNALYSALPYVAMWVLSYVYMISADVVLKNKWGSLMVIRKTISTFAMWGPAALLIGIGFLDESQVALAITFITLNVGLNSGHIIGSLLNQIDLAPNHAGSIMGLLNTLVSIISFVVPIAVGCIVQDGSDRNQWQIVFLVAAALFFVGNLQFLFFAQTNAQPWNEEDFLTKHDVEKCHETPKAIQ